jgi:hypothetical protein
MSAPARCAVSVTDVSRSPFSDSGTASGSSSQRLDHEPTCASTGTRSTAGPGTDPLAAAISAARSPAARAARGVRSGIA